MLYSQTQQSAQDQGTPSNATNQHQLSQSYYAGGSARQTSQNSRAATTQYNGLHFPAPAPAPPRQPTTAHPITSTSENGRDVGETIRSTAYSAGSAIGHKPQGLYHQAGKTNTSQSTQRSAGATRPQDRAEHALSATTNWNAGADSNSIPRQTAATSRTEPSSDYRYSYRQPGASSAQASCYSAQRESNVQANAQQLSLGDNSYDQSTVYMSSNTQSSSKAPQATSRKYQQPAQNTLNTSYGSRYDSNIGRNDTTTTTSSTYQQNAGYEKSYQDDTDRDHTSLRSNYALPQPVPNRNSTGTSNSYFSHNPAAESSYAPTASTQSTKLNSSYQTNYERPAQRIGESSASVNSMSTFDYPSAAVPGPSQTYYPPYTSSEATNQASTYFGSVPANSTNQSIPPAAPTSSQSLAESTTLATTKPKKPRQTPSQNPPAVKTPKPRAPKKQKISVVTPTATPVELPKQHNFYPAASNSSFSPTSVNTSHDIRMTITPQSTSVKDVSGPSGPQASQPLSAGSSSSAPALDMASMEQHMREMVEKMREYQSKDPYAFQQVWENVKRSGPGATAVKPAAPPAAPVPKNTPGVTSPKSSKSAKAAKSIAKKSTPSVAEGRGTPNPGSAASRAQKTVWPASQKVPLSQTTSKFFKNVGQNCPESFALGLLDYGPSFPELCQKLEAHGYKFERNKLAIELLKTSDTVQDSDGKATASHSAPAISAVKPVTSSGTVSVLETPTRTLTPQSIKSFNPRNIKESIPTFLPADNFYDQPQTFVTPSMIYREVYPITVSQPESNVRADQTVIPPTPLAEEVQHVLETPVAQYLVKKRVSMANISKQSPPVNSLPPQLSRMPTILTQPQAPVAPQMPREEIMTDAGPLPSLPPNRLEGLYDRHGLISPPVPSNNLQDSPVNEMLQSRLSKLDAQIMRLKELESPSQPPPPPLVVLPSNKTSPPPPPPPIRKPMLPKPPVLDKKKALRRNTYDPQNIVHGVLLATGRHPNYEGLNSGLAILKRLHPEVFDNSVDLAQIPWDLYDPPPAPLPGEEKKGRRGATANEEDSRGRNRDPVPFTPGVRRTEPDLSAPAYADGQVVGKRGRPRGRPRGARSGRGSTFIGREGLTNKHAGSSGESSTQANTHKYGVTRVNIHSLNRGGGGNNGRDSGGRKRKHGDSPHSRQPSGSDRWGNGVSKLVPVFKCQWEKCNYELQNLDTLRKHLLKKHKAENNMGVMPCCWGECGSLIPVESLDPNTGKKIIESRRKRLNFGTGAAWDSHVLGEHLKVVKEELGEGMSIKEARSISRESSAHSVEGRIRSMSRDRRGHSVTPVITPAPYGYKFTPPPGFSARSQFRHAHDFDNDLPNEKKMLEDALARVERIGSGMETFGLSAIPGAEYDSGTGYLIKVRKLTEDLDRLPPHPPIKEEQDPIEVSPKGKQRDS
ncbi:hypothetical protein TWF694_006741 [Orbilia ellipsospora]|uniref:C2H2-type domain-containing protein n=1 Tax=Orbilia ellipsospora TaxID=2528407 RepID=A0AAV9XL12_9PEZI